MKLNKDEYLYFLKNARFTIPVLITLLIGFTFTLTNPSVGIDDLAMSRYLNGELFAQGRITLTLMQKVLGLTSFEPFVLDFLAVLCFFFAAVTFCVLFRRAASDRLHFFSYVFFACLFVSYPLISEIFIYMGAGLAVCFGYLLAGLALIFVFNWLNKPKSRYFYLTVACIAVITSGYESLIIVYICGVFAMLILRFLFSDNSEYKKFKPNLLDGLKAAIPLAFGVILEFIISMTLIILLGLKISANGQNSIAYVLQDASTLLLIKRVVVRILFRYIFMATSYFPITILNAAGIIAVVLMIVYGIRKKSITIVLLFMGIISSLIMLTVVQGLITPYRACQVFGFFAAFIFMLTLQTVLQSNRCIKIKPVFGVLACLLILWQAGNLNKWFYVDYLRYKEDVNVAGIIAANLTTDFDIENKPVVFTGVHHDSDNLKQYTRLTADTPQFILLEKIESKLKIPFKTYLNINNEIVITDNIGNTCISYGVVAFQEVNTELLKFFANEGYTLKQGTKEMYSEAMISARNMSSWPQNGSIADMGNYILVNF